MTRKQVTPLERPFLWAALEQRWRYAFGCDMPAGVSRYQLPALLDDDQLYALGFSYASRRKVPPRVDRNQHP